MTTTEISEILHKIIVKWCHQSVINGKYGINQSVPFISFEVATNQNNHVIVRIFVHHDPFGMSENVESRTYYNIQYVEYNTLESQFIHALTFKSSPYYLKDGKFHKKLEILG